MTVSSRTCGSPGIAQDENRDSEVRNHGSTSVRVRPPDLHPAEPAGMPSLQGAMGHSKLPRGCRSSCRSGLASVMTRLLGGGAWSPADLVEIVGSAWRGESYQADALAALLYRAVPATDRVALGEVWEAATASLVGRPGPLTLLAAGRLLERWRQLAGERTDSWRRPRSQRRKQGRRSVHPMGDLSRVGS
jgi:hypothetical protein